MIKYEGGVEVKKIAVLLALCMLNLTTMSVLSAAAQPREERPLAAASGKGKDEGKGEKKDDVKVKEVKDAKKNEDKKEKANQGQPGKGKYSNRTPTYKNGVIFSSNLRIVEIRPLAVSYGLVGYKPLPPGIRKNLMRGKPLPPGIAKKMVPHVLWVDLPHYSGYEWRIAGTDLILVLLAKGSIVDILSDIFD